MLTLVLLTLLLLLASQVSAEPILFQSWFSGFGDYYDEKIQSSCRQDYEAYLNNSICSSCSLDWPATGSGRQPIEVINCLLKHSEEFVKANLAVGTVILGLLPTVLSLSASSTVEIGLLALRRPLLASILALGCPAIYPLRTFDLHNIKTPLQAELTPTKSARITSSLLFKIINIIEYVLALGAVASTGTQIWTLCVRSLSALGPDLIFWVLFWPFITFFMHLLGTMHVSFRAKVVPPLKTFNERLNMEFSPCASHSSHLTEPQPMNYVATLLAWTISLFSMCYLIYATAALSSLLFISVFDAIFVALRLAASAAMTRSIVDYELGGMNQSGNKS